MRKNIQMNNKFGLNQTYHLIIYTYLFKASEDMFHGDASLSSSGGLSVAIPGEIKGYAKAKEMFGNPAVSWESLIQPSIELARKGIPVTFSKARCHISIFDDRKIFFHFFIDGRNCKEV